MRGMSWMVQHVLGKPGRGSSSAQVTLYDLRRQKLQSVGRTDCGSTPDASHSPVLHRTHVVIHHSHGVPVEQGAHHHLQHVLIPELVEITLGLKRGSCGGHSHDPYPCDGEGGQADGQDDPGGHWAGRGLALSRAWGEMGALARSGGDTAGGIRWGGGWGVH